MPASPAYGNFKAFADTRRIHTIHASPHNNRLPIAMHCHLILARARNGVIGRHGALPWHLPQDLAHFRRTTWGAHVLMGRTTWEGLPERYRPLPGRQNVVLTRQADWQAPGALVAHSLEEALALGADDGIAWVIGGAQTYALALPLAEEAVITEIDADYDGDAYAPEFDPAQWVEVSRDAHCTPEGLRFALVRWGRLAQNCCGSARRTTEEST
ncbi:dihydrofolate reductase [Candidatus Symbiobacter mobilis CR]|uniref:dihydrofolate reductase n=2 Tax=Candidatus Symbiobacter TaxID=1436289 RepID=U5NC46_9BURK|nr:dihydrofolate reductase [Candidatus Symbiobacter mobilis CR]